MSDRATARCGDGLAAQARGDQAAAFTAFSDAVALAPERHDLRLILTFALAAAGRTADAIHVIEQLPHPEQLSPSAAREVVEAAMAIGADRVAEQALRTVLRSAPHDAAMLAARGVLAERADRLDDAIAHLDAALSQRPGLVSALVSRSRVEARRGQWDAASATLDRALAIAPDHAHARHQRGLLRLSMGHLAAGWADAEARRSLPWHQQAAPRGIPGWDGVHRESQPLIVWGEQGIGDQLQFVRFVPELQRRARSRVVLHVAASLRTLITEAFPGIEIAVLGSPVPATAAHVPMMSLPWLLGATDESALSGAAYLPRARRLHPMSTTPPRIGICWAGNPRHAHDRARSIPLGELPSLVESFDAEWVSLQVGDPEHARQTHPVLGAAICAPARSPSDFRDTAAVISSLDAVITVDTAVAHLSGALGVPTWTLIAAFPDWRWQLERADTVWYDAMRLVRCGAGESWRTVLPRAAQQVADYFRSSDDVKAA